MPTSGIADKAGLSGVEASALASAAVTARSLGPVTTEFVIGSYASLSGAIGCPEGSRVLSGGTCWVDVVTLNATTPAALHAVYSRPSDNLWQARGYNGTADNDARFVVYAIA